MSEIRDNRIYREIVDRTSDGGPAFPVAANEYGGHGPAFGMSLRDYFAGQALHGLMANPEGPVQRSSQRGWDFVNCKPDEVACLAYYMADAMLRAREAK